MIFTKRFKKQDEESKNLEEVLKALDAVQAVAWFDIKGKFLEANETFLAMMGYSQGEIEGEHHNLIVAESDVNGQTNMQLWESLAQGETQSGKFQRFDKSGRLVWIEGSYNPVLDEAGNPHKVVAFGIEITEARKKAVDAQGKLAALSKSQAVIEFCLDGTILSANENFLTTLKYDRSEIEGKHHRIFVDPTEAGSQSYIDFWKELASGEFRSGEYMRLAKDGSEVWIQASYNPIFDHNGKPIKVVKFASDITKEKLLAADAKGQLQAISKAQAVIEFDLTGTVLTANDNFLGAMGYRLEEIVGQHHSIFVPTELSSTEEYVQFWKSLAKGEFRSDEFRRVGKNGKDVWIQASYNPILGPNGEVAKIVKYAVDITDRKMALQELASGLSGLASGDLSIRLPSTLHSEFNAVGSSFNDTMERLEELVQGILETAVAMAGETEAIADIANTLATRSERQAASVEETSAAIDEISSTIQSTARNADAATAAARNAAQNAQSGNSIVTEAIAAMHRIEESAGEIGQVVEVIDGIAFQTNLLALNAGVEAARAGEAGSGFAVVASEVRALAQKAAESARQINDLIRTSNDEVGQGAKLVQNSGKALQDIEAGVNDVVGNINDIQNASNEQAQGITEVTNSVVEIDSTIQKTAAMAEESSAAAAMLADRAVKLRELVRYFKVSGQSDGGYKAPVQNTHNPRPAQRAAAVASGNAAVAVDESAFDNSGWSDF